MIELESVQDFSKSIMNGEGAGHKTENENISSDDPASQLSSNLGKLGKENLVYDVNIETETTKEDMLEEFETEGTTKRKIVQETTGEANNNDDEDPQDEQQKSEVIAEGQYEFNTKNEENNSTANKKIGSSPNHNFKQPKPPKAGASLLGNSRNASPRTINSRPQILGTYTRTNSTTQSSKGTVLMSRKGNEARDDNAEISLPASKDSLHRRVSVGTVRQNATIPRPFSLATDKRASLGVRHSSGEVAGVESRRPIMNNVIAPFAERRQSATKSASAVSETKHLQHVGHKIPPTGASKGRPSSGTSASVSNFKCNERAELNKKEFSSEFEEKFHAKEGRKQLQAKTKDQQEGQSENARKSLSFKVTPIPSFYREAAPPKPELKKGQQEGQLENVRKSLSFKATPMPSFYREAAPPKPELKKIPPTRPKSPKLGRRNSSSGLDSDGNPSQSHISARSSLGHNNIERHLQKPRQDNASKTPSKANSAVKKSTQSLLTTRPDNSVKTKYNGSRNPDTPKQEASDIPETGYPNDQIPTNMPVNDSSESSTNEGKIVPQEVDGVQEKNELKPKSATDCSESSTNEEKVILQETDAVEGKLMLLKSNDETE